MTNAAGAFLGRVTFVTGLEKHCGKTTYLNRALHLVRRVEPPAFMSVGYDGERRDSLSNLRKPDVPVWPGDVVVSAERFLRASRIQPEILEALPGTTAFGPLAVARAHRPGHLVLVGPEGNDGVVRALDFIVGEGAARTVLVDGAINRITQVASFPRARFVFVVRVGRDNLDACARRMRHLFRLSRLRVATSAELERGADTYTVSGPLTAAAVAQIPARTRTVIVDDFTKVFLDEREFASLARSCEVLVRAAPEFAGFVAVARGVSDARLLDALADPEVATAVSFNPYRPTEAF